MARVMNRRGFAIGMVIWSGTIGGVGGPLLLMTAAAAASPASTAVLSPGGYPLLAGAAGALVLLPAAVLLAYRTEMRPAEPERNMPCLCESVSSEREISAARTCGDLPGR